MTADATNVGVSVAGSLGVTVTVLATAYGPDAPRTDAIQERAGVATRRATRSTPTMRLKGIRMIAPNDGCPPSEPAPTVERTVLGV
jgi:hypothetical protein